MPRNRAACGTLRCKPGISRNSPRIRLRRPSASELSIVIGPHRRGGQKAGVVSLLSSLSKTPETTVRLEGVSREV